MNMRTGIAIAAALCLGACAPDPAPSPVRSDAAAVAAAPTDTLEALRLRMVEEQIRARGIEDPAVLAAMRAVPRHHFVPGALPAAAYQDHPLPIAAGQTISQPYIVAYMTEAAGVAPGDRVLEIGTGSGYAAAVLAQIADAVYTIEIVPELAEGARRVLRELGYDSVHVRTGNGWLGWPEHAPYDAILVTAAPERIPPALVEQLAPGGRMVIPVGDFFQEMRIVERTPDGVVERTTIPVRFVPMTGEPSG